MKSVCVFCGSRDGVKPIYKQKAIELGAVLAKQNIAVVYGGGSIGIMGGVAHSAHDNGGKVTGIIPSFMIEEASHKLDDLIVVTTMHERKAKMENMSEGFIALPGGIGTFEEITEMTTWSALGLHKKPLGLLNVEGFYNHFMKQLEVMVQEGFLNQEIIDRVVIEEDPAKLIEKMLEKKGTL